MELSKSYKHSSGWVIKACFIDEKTIESLAEELGCDLLYLDTDGLGYPFALSLPYHANKRQRDLMAYQREKAPKMVAALIGDYLIEAFDGNHSVMGSAKFNKMFKEIEENGETNAA